ncbi:response regulator [uncultured Flavobacterium sp.]|uniref:response regulator n=1 Tax=uncultured Flavobacterium sp. TaxID=165435 RepID=UPI0030EE9B56|tara:strand:+ start:6422 stop:9139 length:2718 start_codon:yes stop_codon:yes gene_type:complete
MKILLLEDNSSDADLAKIGLSRLIPDVVIKHASTVEQARMFLHANPSFDIALFDVSLPDGNGIEFLLEIRQQYLDFPVIILTGSGDEDSAVTALKIGAEDYVLKHADYISSLPEIIDQAITNFKKNVLNKSEIIDVLYIEHHAADVDFTIRHFAQYAPNIHIKAVSTADEALLKLNTKNAEKYKVILMDYRLPGMDALELIKTIRQQLKLNTPIILVTGQGSEELAVQALKVGANDYLTKSEDYLIRLPNLIINSYQHWELNRKHLAQKESEYKYRLLADNSADIIFALDMDLNFTYISPAVKYMRGFEPEEAIKQKLNEVLTYTSYQKVIKLISELLSEKLYLQEHIDLQKSIELEMFRKDGTTIWTEVKTSLILDEKKEPVGILGVTRDISDRKIISEKLLKLSRAVEQSPTLIVITDTNGIIEYVNPKFTEITGYALDEVIGKNTNILKSGHTSALEYKKIWKIIADGGEWRGEFHNKRKDGTLYWEEASISSIKNLEGEITHYLAVKTDITEKKKIIDELIISKEKAEESDRLKSAFLANISHEIRTPMNGILGFSELLKEPSLTGDEQRKYLEIIEESGNRMLNIINNIVDISKIEAGLVKLSNSETNINDQIEYAYTFFKPEAEKKGIQLIHNSSLLKQEAFLNIDREKLYSILLNLIKNAIKYTDKGIIEIGYKLIKLNKDSYIEFYISDTGIGISADQQDVVFKRFIQADITDRHARHGAGLGLSISKAFVELMGGNIRVESQQGKGSIFYFTVPYTATNLVIKEEKQSMDSADFGLPNKLKILIAEDDEISKTLLSFLLKPIANELLIAKNGEEAVKLYKANPDIDIILMDIQMPIMDGFEATRQIRLLNKNVKIIAQTAFALSGDEGKIKNAGCNSYINKPIKKEALYLAIKENL